jgi:aldose 1-epimerase
MNMTTKISPTYFGTTIGGHKIFLYSLRNSKGVEIKIMNYGATIVSIETPDKNGILKDIVLGYDTLKEYEQDKFYMGCIVGRVCGRISNAKFSLDGKEYNLAQNLPPHHLHGGFSGWNKKAWQMVSYDSRSVEFSYVSPEKEENYPGEVITLVKYTLSEDNKLTISYHATTNKPTHINLTNHTYFNLSGDSAHTVEDDLIQVNASQYLEYSNSGVPTGKIKEVENTCFDARKMRPFTELLDFSDGQVKSCEGVDTTWALNNNNQLVHAASLLNSETGRKINVYTTEPGMHVYTSNYLPTGFKSKGNTTFTKRGAVCLETQHYPDSPNLSHFPSSLLLPGKLFTSQTIFEF